MFSAGNAGPYANVAVDELKSDIHAMAITSVGYSTTVNYGEQGSSIMAAAYGGDLNYKLMVNSTLKFKWYLG